MNSTISEKMSKRNKKTCTEELRKMTDTTWHHSKLTRTNRMPIQY